MATVGRALLILALVVAALRHRRLALRRARAAAASGSSRAAARSTRSPRSCTRRLRDPRARVPALGLHLRDRRQPLLDDDADLLQGRRRVVLAGGLAAAVAVAAVAVVEPRAVPHAPRSCAASRPTRPPSCSASRRSSRRCSSSSRRRSALLAVVPAEGNGLNPLLRHPSMMIHPPMLYSGYTLFAIPFAFAVGALIARQVGAADWIRATRRFALAAWFFLGDRDPARRALVLRRAGLGRLLGLGPGRERVAAAVADRHRVPALDHDPGEARDAEDLERLARPRDRHPGDPRHVPRALGDPRLDPRLRRLDARRAVRDPHRRS